DLLPHFEALAPELDPIGRSFVKWFADMYRTAPAPTRSWLALIPVKTPTTDDRYEYPETHLAQLWFASEKRARGWGWKPEGGRYSGNDHTYVRADTVGKI